MVIILHWQHAPAGGQESDEAGVQEAKNARQTLSGGAEGLQSKRAQVPKLPEKSGFLAVCVIASALLACLLCLFLRFVCLFVLLSGSPLALSWPPAFLLCCNPTDASRRCKIITITHFGRARGHQKDHEAEVLV